MLRNRLEECGEHADEQARPLWEDRHGPGKWTRLARAKVPSTAPPPLSSSAPFLQSHPPPSPTPALRSTDSSGQLLPLRGIKGPWSWLALDPSETGFLFLWAVLPFFLSSEPALLLWARASAHCGLMLVTVRRDFSMRAACDPFFLWSHLMIKQSLVLPGPLAEGTLGLWCLCTLELSIGFSPSSVLQTWGGLVTWPESPWVWEVFWGTRSTVDPDLSFICKLAISPWICSNTRLAASGFWLWMLNLLPLAKAWVSSRSLSFSEVLAVWLVFLCEPLLCLWDSTRQEPSRY